jgi:hypothetical protein
VANIFHTSVARFALLARFKSESYNPTLGSKYVISRIIAPAGWKNSGYAGAARNLWR